MPKKDYDVILLDDVKNCKIKNKQIFILFHEEGMKDEFSVYIKGVERLYSICYKDRHIKYLNSFDEFSEKDKKIFDKMQKENNK